MKKGLSFIKNIGMALAMGLVVGIMAVLFNMAIENGVDLTSRILGNNNSLYFILPLVGGVFIIAIYAIYLKKDYTGIGIVQVLVELEKIKTHMMKPLKVLVQIIGAIITLVFGFSAGRFGPIVHLGASVGSNAAYYFKLKANDIKLLIGCGAASAIAAVFGMPLFASVFVLEVLYKKQFANYFAPVVIASFIAHILGSLTGQSIMKPDFTGVMSVQWSDIPGFILLGVAMGLAGIAYIISINKFTNLFEKIKSITLRLAIGAIAISLIGIFMPLNFELHQQTTLATLNGEMAIWLLLLIGVVKLFATAITLGSGYVGGNFYPAVTIGSAWGMAMGKLVNRGQANAQYGVLGMGSILAACLNAPISGIVWVIEFSGQVELILPALLVCALSVMTTYHLFGQDIFTVSYAKTIK